MSIKKIYSHLLSEEITYQIYPFGKFHDASVLVTMNDVNVFCSIDLLENTSALYVNFRKASQMISDSHVVIARSIDKILRPFMTKINHTVSINVVQLSDKNTNIQYLATLAAIIASRTLFPIEIGLFFEHNEQKSLFLSGNKKAIYSIEWFSPPDVNTTKEEQQKNMMSYFKTAIEHCEKMKQELDLITPKYPFKTIRKAKLNFTSIDGKYLNSDTESFRMAMSAFLAENPAHHKQQLRNIEFNNQQTVFFQRGETCCIPVFKLEKESTLQIRYNFTKISCKSANEPSKRRSIGHGVMINNIVRRVVDTDLPLSIHCEILQSNGSSSMASICAICVLLRSFNIAIPMFSGISVGLFRSNKTNTLKVDLEAVEDKYSEMDFKISSTKSSVVGISMDTKSYLPVSFLEKAIILGMHTNDSIIDQINHLKPRWTLMKIDNVGYFVGKNGITIKTIQTVTNSKLSIFGAYLYIEENNHIHLIDIINTYTQKQFKKNMEYFFICQEGTIFLPHIKKITSNVPISNGIHRFVIKDASDDLLIVG